MRKNKIIEYASIAAKGALMISYVFYAAFALLILYWFIDASALSFIEISDGFNAGYGLNGIKFITSAHLPSAADIIMSDLNAIMVVWLLIRNSIFFMLAVTIIKKAIAILQSIKDIKTFYIGNITHFRQIANHGFLIFLFSSFNYLHWNDFSILSLEFPMGPLLLAVSALVLSEVFKEGKHIFEDKNLII